MKVFFNSLFVSTASVALLLSNSAPARSVENLEPRIDALLSQMTLAEKIGQMTQVDSSGLKDKSDIQKYALGSVLSGGDSDPPSNTPEAWLKLAQEFQSWAQKTRLKIPLLYGIDAVHGHNNVDGAVVFPHNIGLGATRNPALVEQAARVTAAEVAGTGINWAFAPCLAVAQDARWGRTYESFSSAPEVVSQLGAAAIRGFQAADASSLSPGILACAKHFVGDGGTRGGVDQGDTMVDEPTLRKIHLAPYPAAIQAGAGSVMVSYSSWNSKKMHGNKQLITDVLKGELGFKGFVISDYAAIDQLSANYKTDIEQAINAGLDMAMVPFGPGHANNYIDFITKLTELVDEGKVPQTRIDDAVRRILRAKFEVDALEQKTVPAALTAQIGSAAHRQVARECVRQSVVLLKNENSVLPLSATVKQIKVIGAGADDIGMQCGGWTISWQGASGKVTHGGTTILEAIRKSVAAGSTVTFSPDGSNLGADDIVVAVVGEKPYAEMKGDDKQLQLSASDIALVKKAKKGGARVVTILLSGRPLILGEAHNSSDAIIAAWLPGTEGQGISDILFGAYAPTGKLPRLWPRDAAAVASNSTADPLFPLGFGLTYHAQAPAKTASAR